jgi:hypothetical protein
MQRGASDNYLVRGRNGDLREGNPRNSDGLLKPGEAVLQLRQVSELRACSWSLQNSRSPISLHSPYLSGRV